CLYSSTSPRLRNRRKNVNRLPWEISRPVSALKACRMAASVLLPSIARHSRYSSAVKMCRSPDRGSTIVTLETAESAWLSRTISRSAGKRGCELHISDASVSGLAAMASESEYRDKDRYPPNRNERCKLKSDNIC